MDPQKRVLIVEADNTFALSLAAVLSEHGFPSAIAASAADAQREIKERKPSLVLLRAELPDLSGFTLCGRLRKDKNAHGLPIILVSSDATAEVLAEHRSHPASAADGYLSVPFPMDELVSQVETLLSFVDQPPVEEAAVTAVPEPVPAPAPGDEDLEGALEGALQDAPVDPTAAAGGLDAMMAPLAPPRPPRIPKRPRRSSSTESSNRSRIGGPNSWPSRTTRCAARQSSASFSRRPKASSRSCARS